MMKFLFPARPLLRGLGAVLLSAGLLAACGGSTSSVSQFVPQRLIVFGDEFSAINDRNSNGNGYNYAMNGVDASDSTNNTLACDSSSQFNWVQKLASNLGMTFAECNRNNLDSSSLKAFNLAKFGATARTLAGQVENFQANVTHDALNSGDLATVLVGVEDVVEIYYDNLTFGTEGDKTNEAEARGRLVGQQVNALADTGARVIVSQIFDVGVSPWALAQGSSEATLITNISEAFNRGLRLALVNDGSKIGLVSLNDIVANQVRFGSHNNTDLACNDLHVETITSQDADADGYIDGGDKLNTCTTATVTADTAAADYLWADGLRFGARIIHAQLASSAISRLQNNPF